MGKKAGALLWSRQRITITPAPTSIDTHITQDIKAFAGMSPNEPTFGVTIVPPGPADGSLPASRVQVIPQAPLSKWANVTHGEPFYNPTTGTIWVTFIGINESTVVDLNVLFWNPHSMVGPGQADTYHPAP